MKLKIENQMVRLWNDVILHLNDDAKTMFQRLQKQAVEIHKTGGRYIIVDKKGERYHYSLHFKERKPDSHLIQIDKDYKGKSWHKPTSLVVWRKE